MPDKGPAPSQPGDTPPGAPVDETYTLPGIAVGVAGPTASEGQTYASAADLVSAFGKQDVKVEIDTLTTFAKKIEQLLLVMDGSAAAPYKVKAQKVEGPHLGADFDEATALTGAYDKVHKELAKLHKDFASQIQAMKDSVAKSAGNYASNEDHTTTQQKTVAANASAPPVDSKRADN
ncbi:hypothetical protein [Kitasatospora sp. NPDC101183]|uniref:hypothetical protein n=1 Tax=Kitasatospora sp. NPDC101183 TaxID=3364100 RepID=UPI0037F2E584